MIAIKAITSVIGMISDVMEIGVTAPPKTESVSPIELVGSVLDEVFKYDKNTKIDFSYDWTHDSNISVDRLKIIRLMSNILVNATQALDRQGQIWFKTRELAVGDESFIQFCIGNNGKHIEKKNLKNLFEAFYTEGKRGGTGLGLAIAKKIVTSHGGEISCRSTKSEGVNFFFTLPVSSTIEQNSFRQILGGSSILTDPIESEEVDPSRILR